MKLTYFNIADNEIYVQGRRLSEWAERAHRRPFYIYDRDVILKKISQVRSSIPSEIDLHYAVKANPLPELVEFVAKHVDGFDVASGGELRTVLAAGGRPDHIGFAGPGKSEDELQLAIESGVLISVESLTEISRISRISRTKKLRPRVALRINPEFEMKSSGMKMGGGPKQFGIDSENVPEAIQYLESFGIPIEGLHIYAGSQNLNAKILVEIQRKCFELLIALKKHLPGPIKTFNFGGGFGIPYFEGDADLDLDKVGDNLRSLMPAFQAEFPGTRAILELGRFLVGEAGLFVAEIVDKKISRGVTFLVLNGGMNQHLAASGNLGQTIKRNFPILVANKTQEKQKEIVTVVGPLCTPLDQFGSNIEVSRCEIGDLVAIFQSGAYGLSASPIHFLSHDPPREFFP